MGYNSAMPELPEVESIRLQLKKFLIGHTIIDVEVRYGKNFIGDINDIIGGKIVDIRRFGKVQIIDLDNGYSIIIHIKMTGQLLYTGPNLRSNSLSKKVLGGLGGKHTHVIFTLSHNGMLYYNDVRKFGWIHIYKTEDIPKHKFIKSLGKEFLKDLTEEEFKKILDKSSRPIKILLMDQNKMAGLGNIYANDALYLAHINPKLPAKTIQTDMVKNLYDYCCLVLKEGIKRGGASELSFVTPDGAEGSYQNYSPVYKKEGTKCNNCGSVIVKYKLGGRGTYICPNCQK